MYVEMHWTCAESNIMIVKTTSLSPQPWPGGTVGWSTNHIPKYCGFNAQSGHTPRLRVQSQSGGIPEATNQSFSLTLMSVCLSLSLPSSLSQISKHILKLGFKRKIFKPPASAQYTIPPHPASPSVVEMELYGILVQDSHLCARIQSSSLPNAC